MVLTNLEAMELAISEAKKGLGFVSPNPAVGCVILSASNEFLSSGFHTKAGQPHAEIEAIQKNSNPFQTLKGAKLFVSLEPCSHVGKTPSCAHYLKTFPLSEVWYGMKDPNPKVNGQGIQILEQAGIKVQEFGLFRHELEELLEVFLVNQIEKRPFVCLKVASSLDGKIANEKGESKWLTGDKSRAKVHEIRGLYDGIAVGADTILTNNPSLDIRSESFSKRKNFVIVFDRSKKIKDKNYKIFSTHESSKILLLQDQKSCREKLDFLFSLGINSIMLEGGSGLYSSFLQENLVDKVHCFIAPKILGNGKSWAEKFHSKSLDATMLTRLKTENFENDLLLSGYLKNANHIFS